MMLSIPPSAIAAIARLASPSARSMALETNEKKTITAPETMIRA